MKTVVTLLILFAESAAGSDIAKWIVALFVPLGLWAEPPIPPLPTSSGFIELSDPRVPAGVRAALNGVSVVKIAVGAGRWVRVSDYFVNDRSIQDIRERLIKKRVSTHFRQSEKDVYLYELGLCGSSTKPSECIVHEQVLENSAYLVGDGRRIRTALHVVHDAVTAAWSPTPGEMQTAKIPLFIYDGEGKKIASPDNAEFVAVFLREAIEFRRDSGAAIPPYLDLVEIHSDRKIGEPLEPSLVAANLGDLIYIAGYPGGGQLRVSSGRILTLTQAIISDAYGGRGLDGAVTLNSAGQVLGTYTASTSENGRLGSKSISFSSNDALLNYKIVR